MHSPEIKQAALELIAAGHNDCEVSRRLGIPRRTILEWRRPSYKRRVGTERCPRCWRPAKPVSFTADDYAELLGLYLGDGCISEHARTCRLRIALDAKYARIISDAAALTRRCFPANRVDVVTAGLKGNCVNISVYSQHLPCLFPQHGRGPKHERRLILERWQAELVEAAPCGFLRGCIRSDGSVYVNRTGPYEYLSYEFSNRSHDLIRAFASTCDLVGVEHRVNGPDKRGRWSVRIYRRPSVALMQTHVGGKN